MTSNGSQPRRPLRLANFSGCLGDRFTALAEAVALLDALFKVHPPINHDAGDHDGI